MSILVLKVEQMMTTGGGWQDQIGGIVAGIKLGSSSENLPLRIHCRRLQVDSRTVDSLNQRLILIYSGKTRLAKNLLQNVIRNWYARDKKIVSTVDNLREEAICCAGAMEKGDIETVSLYVNNYWKLKQIMAPGCQPKDVAILIKALQPYIS